jgi:triacylglycerol lipase
MDAAASGATPAPIGNLTPPHPTADEHRGRAGVHWINRMAAVCTLPIARELQTVASWDAVRQHRVWVEPPLDARALPVLLIGGLATSTAQLGTLAEWLTRLNCRVQIAAIGFGLGCGEWTLRQAGRELADLAERSGERCVVVGHSRGGQIARALTVRSPELVRGLIVLGSPLNRLLGVHPLLKVQVAMLGLAGTLGLPGLLRPSCLWGMCCSRLRSEVVAPLPVDVSYVSVFSKRDRMVDWRSTLDPAARHREVTTSHSGLVCAPEAFQVLAEELGGLVTSGVAHPLAV